jgi:serine/threonine protein kinase
VAEARRDCQLPIGERVLWYEVEAVVEEDDFGVTYKARDTQATPPSADRNIGLPVVAIRELLPRELIERCDGTEVQVASEVHAEAFLEARAQFIDEAETLATLRHPAIVKVHFQRRANATAYMVMEWIEGACLRAQLEHWQQLSESDLMRRLDPLFDALTLVHEAGLVHANISPDNVWLRADGSPVLVNFSAAQFAYQRRMHEPLIGLASGYAACEQYLGDDTSVGPWTDVYAVAALIYRIVTGFRPADALERSMCRSGEPESQRAATELATGRYSSALLAAVDRALSVEIAARPQTISELRGLLTTETKGFANARAAPPLIPAKLVASDPDPDPEPEPEPEPVEQTPPPNIDVAALPLPPSASPAPSVRLHRRHSELVSGIVRGVPALRVFKDLLALRWFAGSGLVTLAFVAIAILFYLVFAPGWGANNSTVTRAPDLGDVAGQTLSSLLSQAELAEAAARYVEPSGNSAGDAYLAALNIDPENERALMGLSRIVTLVEARAVRASRARNKADALRYGSQVLRLLRGAQVETHLGVGTQLWLEAEIDALLVKLPGIDVRRGPATARRLIPLTHAERFASRVSRLLLQAQQAARDGNPSMARYYATTALSLHPGNTHAATILAQLK